jgi:hypothetical protein
MPMARANEIPRCYFGEANAPVKIENTMKNRNYYPALISTDVPIFSKGIYEPYLAY